MVDVYNQTLKSCLDDLLPVRYKTITEHFNCPFYNDEIRAAKQCRRKLERQWRKSRSDHHRALYVNQCKFVTTLLKRAKAEYYQTKVIECKKDQKALFRVLNELMHINNNDGNEIVNGIPCDDLAERLNHYFIEKIDHIRDHLVNTPDLTNIDHPVTVIPHLLCFLYRHLIMSQRKQWRGQCSHDLLSTVHLTQFQRGFWRTLLTFWHLT